MQVDLLYLLLPILIIGFAASIFYLKHKKGNLKLFHTIEASQSRLNRKTIILSSWVVLFTAVVVMLLLAGGDILGVSSPQSIYAIIKTVAVVIVFITVFMIVKKRK